MAQPKTAEEKPKQMHQENKIFFPRIGKGYDEI
jgi:hypothetical protein